MGSGATPRRAGRAAGPTAITFAAVIGLGIAYPLLPFQAAALGASPVLITLLLAVDTLVILLAAPLIGRLSDRVGRKPVIVAGLCAGPAAYLMMAGADHLAWLYASRLFAGLAGAVVSVIQAYLADRTAPGDRAVAMAGINGCFGLAFVVGPLIVIATAGAGGSDFATPAIIAAGFAAAAVALAATLLQPGRPTATPLRSDPMPALRGRVWRTARAPACLAALCVLALLVFAHEATMATLAIWAERSFGWGVHPVALAFALCGLAAVLAPSVMHAGWARRCGEKTLTATGGLAIAAGLALLGTAGPDRAPGVAVALAMVLLGAGVVLVLSALQSLISRMAPPDVQGGMLGVSHAVASLARVVGPLWGGALLVHAGPSAPYLWGTGLALLAVLLLARVPAATAICAAALAPVAACRFTGSDGA